jgi:hypothetical protein
MDLKEFLKQIDYQKLRKQKRTLVKMEFHPETYHLSEKEQARMRGILYLIDYIQDTAVEELGLDKNKVFDLIKEEDEII